MKYTFYLSFLMLAMFLFSCKERKHTPKVIYESATTEEIDVAVKETEYQVADLPIAFENVNFLIHPVGQIRVSESKNFVSKNAENFSYTISNFLNYEIQGMFDNLLFQDLTKDSLIAITDKKMQISRVNFLNDYFLKAKRQVFLYEVYDQDSNKDGMIDGSDIKTLFISDEMGKNFEKLSEDRHELIDWTFILATDRLYYRTVEDINKNGQFDSKDLIHYYYIKLSDKTFTPITYTPIQ